MVQGSSINQDLIEFSTESLGTNDKTQPHNAISNGEEGYDQCGNISSILGPTTMLETRAQLFSNFFSHQMLKNILKY